MRRWALSPGARGLHAHPERSTLNNTQYQRRKSIVVRSGLADDRADSRHVGVLDRPAQRVGEQSFGRGSHKCIRPAEQRLAEVVRTVKRRTVHELTRRIDRYARIALTPRPNLVEVLQ